MFTRSWENMVLYISCIRSFYNFIKYRDNILHNANVVHPPSEGGDAPQREHRIPMPSNVSLLSTAGAEIEFAPMFKSRLYPFAPTSSVEVEPNASVEIELAPSSESKCHPPAHTSSIEVELTAGVSTLALRHQSRRHPAWNRIDMVSTMYHSKSKLDSRFFAPVRSLREIKH
ncbi:hypothetical protein Goklo_005392 [Gossypium klotzschianum]|uniref:Uncharacterized protein n=1 Tax=Gossypium klotzschianum TaxID=34286 RepID=A0A7J8VRW8_9ROSI|nr:hypothetical protein [Gossypium klotzschianum]